MVEVEIALVAAQVILLFVSDKGLLLMAVSCARVQGVRVEPEENWKERTGRESEKKREKERKDSTLDSGNPIGTEQYMKDSTDDTHFRPFSLAMPSRFTPL